MWKIIPEVQYLSKGDPKAQELESEDERNNF